MNETSRDKLKINYDQSLSFLTKTLDPYMNVYVY